MRKSKFLVLGMFSLVVLMSCQREPVAPNSPTGGGGNGAASTTSYNPTSVGSWWKYKDSTSGGLSTTTIANRTKSINGILYSAMVSDIAPDTG